MFESGAKSRTGRPTGPKRRRPPAALRFPEARRSHDAREHRLFRAIADARGSVRVAEVLEALAEAGLERRDPRLAATMARLAGRAGDDRLGYREFSDAIGPSVLTIERALQGSLAIPDFRRFRLELDRIHSEAGRDSDGEVASYIPQLARVDPEGFGVAVCTIDGQRHGVGDSAVDFSMQSCCKPVLYLLALEEHGEAVAHGHVGREPSGRVFNDLSLDETGRPHNPMINAGAIMSTALIRQGRPAAERFEHILDRIGALCGGQRPRFNNSVYQSERQSADRNYALAYLMREHGAFPPGTDLAETLDLYFQCCSLELTTEMMAMLAATLANGGVCPTTGERVVSPANVKRCLSLMGSCGMYDFSGEFAFSIGLPAKSGVGGAIYVAVPNLMGLCVWSPRLDRHGNSVGGLRFLEGLVRRFRVHGLDDLAAASEKIDPRVDSIQAETEVLEELMWASSRGDLSAIHRRLAQGFDADVADYDGRTPLHLAAAEGQAHVVEHFVERGVRLDPRDRWGGTPIDDARTHGHLEVARLLERHGATSGAQAPVVDHRADLPAAAERVPGETRGVVELIHAASKGDIEAIRRRIARGSDVDRADYDMRTPLHLAAAEGQLAAVEYLLARGASAAPRDRWGNTPLDDARRHGREDVVAVLQQRGGSGLRRGRGRVRGSLQLASPDRAATAK